MAKYRTALISFIDILGFRQIVETRTCEEISEMLGKMRLFSEGDDSGEGLSAKVAQFSDSIIRIRPLDSQANEDGPYGTLFYELLDIGVMQADLARHNVYIRGGTTIGEVCYDGDVIFGPGFNRAYDLESRIANYPRIILDRKVIEAMKADKRLFSSHNGARDERGFIARQLRCGMDGIHYVDYLKVMLNNMDDPEDGPYGFLAEHKKNILRNITSVSNLNPESAKYLWAANYHNSVVDEVYRRTAETEDLWINETELPLMEVVRDPTEQFAV